MRILLANTYARSGGASVAAVRLCAALNGIGETARLLVQNPEGQDDAALLTTADRWGVCRPMLDALPVLPWTSRRTPHWGNAWLANQAARSAIRDYAPDVTHLHWTNHGMLSVRDVARLKSPLVWTLHDSWAFTGGCHSPQACRHFQDRCGCCPELHSRRAHDLSRWTWSRKYKAWNSAEFTVVTPSHWLADAAASSSLLKGRCIEIIPNAVDTSVFYPDTQSVARAKLGIPEGIPVFLFAAHGAFTDWNKGGDLWRATLPVIAAEYPEAMALVAGADALSIPAQSLPLAVRALGVLSPPDLARAMHAADAVMVPSRMENLPNVIAESFSCGIPVAAFETGGIAEMVVPGRTGFLAQPLDAEALGCAMVQALASRGALRDACLAASSAYAPDVVAARHLDLYKRLVTSR